MEMEKVPAAGYRIEGLSIKRFSTQAYLEKLVFPFRLAGSMLKARSLILKFKTRRGDRRGRVCQRTDPADCCFSGDPCDHPRNRIPIQV